MRRRAAYEPSLIVETTRTGPPPYKTSSLSTGNAGVPPQCVSVLTRRSPQPSVLSSSSSCNEEFSSSSSQRVDEVSTPPAQPETGKSKYRPREFDAIRRVPSSYRPVPTDREVGKRWDIYRKQLASLFRRIVLWEPRTLDPSSSPTLSESWTTPLPDPHGTSPLVSSSEPNTVKQAPLLSSNRSSRPVHDLAPRDIETTEQTLSQAHPLPDAHASLPSPNRVTARVSEPPPLALPTSPSSYNEGTPVSSPSRHIAGRTTYPPAHHKIETPKYQSHEHIGTTPAPSAYQSPSIKKSTSAQPLSRSGLPASSSHPLTRGMSASGSRPEAESRSRPREHPRSTRRANTAPVADADGNQRFPSIVQTVLSGISRYAPDAVS